MRAVGGSRSTTRPWSSTGTPTTSAPRAENRRVTGTYPGFSIATVSPGGCAVPPVSGANRGGTPPAPQRGREQREVRKAGPQVEPAAAGGRPEVRGPAGEPAPRAKGGRRVRPDGPGRERGCHRAAASGASLRV